MVFILGFWVFICGLWVGGWLVISYDFLVSGIMVVGVPGWVNMELNFSRIVLDNFLSNLEAVGYGRSGGCEDDLKNKDDPKNEDDLKNKDD